MGYCSAKSDGIISIHLNWQLRNPKTLPRLSKPVPHVHQNAWAHGDTLEGLVGDDQEHSMEHFVHRTEAMIEWFLNADGAAKWSNN